MENSANVMYKVLWVEDKDDFVGSMKLIAKKQYQINLDRYDNWDDAEIALRDDFKSYSAIILDAYCNTKAGVLKDTFLSYAMKKIAQICGENRSEIPWYVFSEGTMTDFGRTITNLEEGRNSEWGDMLYIKTEDGAYDRLFQNIVNVAQEQSNNVVLFRHKDVFKYLGADCLLDIRARKILFRVLGALYYPEDNIGFEYQGNPLRKVLEYLFRSARKQGLLSPYCFDKDDHVNLTYSSLYMKGDVVTLSGKDIDVEGSIRWGGDCIFPANIASIVHGILIYANVDSHTYEIDESPYYIEEGSKELFFGYVLQLCHVIKWYGEYVKSHSDVKKNQCMQIEKVKPNNSKKENFHDLEGKRGVVEKDENNNYHCLGCILPYTSAQFFLGKEVQLKEVDSNQNKQTKLKYPLHAKFEAVK